MIKLKKGKRFTRENGAPPPARAPLSLALPPPPPLAKLSIASIVDYFASVASVKLRARSGAYRLFVFLPRFYLPLVLSLLSPLVSPPVFTALRVDVRTPIVLDGVRTPCILCSCVCSGSSSNRAPSCSRWRIGREGGRERVRASPSVALFVSR